MDDLVGNKYRIIKRLGEGATKEAFLANDETLHREVALCRFKQHMLADGYLAQVQQEARTLAKLDHPNILRIFDFRDDDGHYMITEYLGGGSLKSKIVEWKSNRDLPKALRIAAEVADALSFTHARGIFHRDVKPSNVMLTKECIAKLGDFGMAKRFTEESLSGSGLIEGTVGYMSPEQCQGLPPDSPADMYSFGITLYEMVIGRRPFHGEDASVLVKHMTEPPPPPTRFYPACPPRLEGLILELLEKEPVVRPSAGQAADELRGIRDELQSDCPGPPQVRPVVQNLDDESRDDHEKRKGDTSDSDRLSDALQHPLTIIPLFVAVLALLAAIVPLLSLSQALFVSAGLLAAGAVSFAWRMRTPADPSPPEPVPDIPLTIDEWKRKRLSDTLQHPSTIVPLFIAALALLAIGIGPLGLSALWSLTAFIVASAVGVASFLWGYFAGYGEAYENHVRKVQEYEDRERRTLELRMLESQRDALRTGLLGAGAEAGVRSLDRISSELESLREVIRRWPERSILWVRMDQLRILAEESYRRGLNLLTGVLDLSFDESDKTEVEAQIGDLEKEIRSLEADGTQAEQLKAREKALAGLREWLELLVRQEAQVEEFLHETSRIERDLRQALIDVASLKVEDVDGHEGAGNEALQRAIDRLRQLLDEMRGFEF